MNSTSIKHAIIFVTVNFFQQCENNISNLYACQTSQQHQPSKHLKNSQAHATTEQFWCKTKPGTDTPPWPLCENIAVQAMQRRNPSSNMYVTVLDVQFTTRQHLSKSRLGTPTLSKLYCSILSVKYCSSTLYREDNDDGSFLVPAEDDAFLNG